MEIERKFKLKENITENKLLELSSLKETYIQTYFIDDDGVEKRVRIHCNSIEILRDKKLNDKAVLCEKSIVDIVNGVEIRDEKETSMDLTTAKSIVLNNLKTTLVKNRLYIPFKDFIYEVDFYMDSFNLPNDMVNSDGKLITVEVEFKNKESMLNFKKEQLPAWVGEDVSDDKRYGNRTLAKMEKKNNDIDVFVKKYCGIKTIKKPV